ncbi:MAG: hypothetical protein JWQ60_2206, partial [Pseudonocardia sp.]|nr:hypothetical protein [Pseudonocardia sp.]
VRDGSSTLRKTRDSGKRHARVVGLIWTDGPSFCNALTCTFIS